MNAVTKRFGAATVLDKVDLAVAAGSFTVIRGANGSGKSTLIRIAATLTSPTEGHISINGVDALRHSADARREIGAVMHSPMLYSDLTIRENLALFATLCQLENPQDRVEAVASRLRLEARLDERVRGLSHGYRKRVAIARSIIHTPNLLLLDEPETGLDESSLEVMLQIVEEWRSRGRSVLMATHGSDFATSAPDAAYLMTAGRLESFESS